MLDTLISVVLALIVTYLYVLFILYVVLPVARILTILGIYGAIKLTQKYKAYRDKSFLESFKHYRGATS